jgi:predicted HTH transcriptional regulator
VKSKEKNSDRVLALLGRNSLATTQEMAAALTLSRAGVEKILRQLKRSGHLRRIGPTKGGRWEVLP